MQQKIANYIRSGHPGLYIVSPEEARVEAELKSLAGLLDYGLHAWSVTEGLVNTADGTARQAQDPLDALEAVAELPENTLVVLRDFHAFLEDANPVLVRTLKDTLARGKTRGTCLVIVGCRQVLPPELQRELTVIDFALPDRLALGDVRGGICDSAGLETPAGDARDAVLEAATGLTTTEAENAFALSVVETGTVSPAVVAREKAAGLKKNGLVEIVELKESLEDIGGLDLLKDWLIRRRDAFTARALEYGLPTPKGLLMVGVPGCGKSLTAKATASVLGRPLLKLDAGRIFGGLVGESEANLRAVIQIAEAIAPAVLWIDEIEKGLSGSKSSGSTDGGTSARVFGSFISWMQEKTAPVFVVATANDVTQLPPELLRKGRWDDLVFIDLPNAAERDAIWRIQIAKHGRDAGRYEVAKLVESSEGHTGAEIEQAFIDALYAAFAESREPGLDDVTSALADAVPLSRLMSEQIQSLRKWAKGRARPASSGDGVGRGGRKIAA
ncbi:MAG: AAA family ATPase [Chloroflexi bacterium]|nr:AAA family ATPase [Chloroflexota bacterium]